MKNIQILLSLFTVSFFLLPGCKQQSTFVGTTKAEEFGDLGNGFFLNPIFPGDFPDPSILRDGDDYYMTHTSHSNYPGLIIWHSKDLVNWKPVAHALDKYMGEIWAPDLIKYNGKFYIYCPLHDTGSNMVTVADRIEGPWSDPVDLNVKGLIDPGHIVGEDGKRYLYCSGGYMAQLSDDGFSVVGELRNVYNGWEYPDNWLDECFCLESPKLKKIGDYFYLISAQGGTSGPATSHMAVVARSKSVFGPWENSPVNPLLHTYSASEKWWSKGHASIVDTPEGDWWVVYHAYLQNFRTLGRNTLLEPLEMTADGWLQTVKGTDPARPVKMPKGENAGTTFKRLGNFEQQFNDYKWQFFEGAVNKKYTVSGDQLTIGATGTKPDDCNPLLFTPFHQSYEAIVDIELTSGSEAGIMLFYNQNFYRGIGITRNEINQYSKGQRYPIWTDDRLTHIKLKLVNSYNTVGFFYSLDGEQWIKAGGGTDISAHTTNLYGGFRSLKIGLFAVGAGEVVFKNFRYFKRQ
jgi:beta-xylosidase